MKSISAPLTTSKRTLIEFWIEIHSHTDLPGCEVYVPKLSATAADAEKIYLCSRQEGFGKKRLNKDGHLITEDSVLPTTAPGGAPEQNRCWTKPLRGRHVRVFT